MTAETNFRTPEEEVLKLLDECAELRRTLKDISAQVGRIEKRVQGAFPNVAAKSKYKKSTASTVTASSLTSEQAYAEFDRVVKMTSSGNSLNAERYVESKSSADLLAIARELGITFKSSKPSIKMMREAIFGKVRESISLTRHSPRD